MIQFKPIISSFLNWLPIINAHQQFFELANVSICMHFGRLPPLFVHCRWQVGEKRFHGPQKGSGVFVDFRSLLYSGARSLRLLNSVNILRTGKRWQVTPNGRSCRSPMLCAIRTERSQLRRSGDQRRTLRMLPELSSVHPPRLPARGNGSYPGKGRASLQR